MSYPRPVVPHYPQHPQLPEPERQSQRNAIARSPPEVRAEILLDWNLYHDYHGYIYALLRWVFDWRTGVFHPQIKYGLTGNVQQRMSGYQKCGPLTWMYCWPTTCVKLTEALIHARLRSRGLAVESFYCSCKHWHREFFWGFGIADVCAEVEEVLRDTAQPITRYFFV
ncbi:hypothetical protein R3P38DRAFT_3235681 [Favolaschia claudopus]|uniref:Bacteriophage T5 Orf172 DNA-binding domain-containing protein n=1 Tax=Favolaschia claudopus TaxID=2862362 RepID=A0AAV9ZET5_9AGAR